MNLKDNAKYILIFLIVGLACVITDNIYKTITDTKIIENKSNYEIFDNCFRIKEHYYCEKTN